MSELLFDPNLTGVMLHGSIFPGSGILRYAVFDQFAGPIEGNPDFEAADHSAGVRLEYTADQGWSVGASYLAARRAGDWRHLGGLDLLWTYKRLELMGELALEDGPRGDGQWGVYLQSVFQLTLRTYFVSRFEHYDFPGSDPSVNLVTLGVAFRPLSGVVLKAEYLIADRTAPEGEPGIYASIGTLF